MGKIYIYQTALDIEATLGCDITGASALLIKYQKPNGDTGSFAATSTDDENGVIEYQVSSEDDIDQAGEWVFWGHVTFADGSYAAGEPYSMTVYREGN